MENGVVGLLGQFIRFAKVGVVGTLAQYLALFVLVQWWDVYAIIASAFGFVLGTVVNYSLNYYYTFQSDRRHREAMTKFFVVAGVGLLLNVLVMTLAMEVFSVHYFLAQLIATGLVLIWNFSGSRWWVFVEKREAKEK